MASSSACRTKHEDLMQPLGERTYRRTQPVARQINGDVEVELQ